ncbi:GDSL-like Lipase/Acylhydrolase family protein [Thermomonospora echinospora]|uniref:GDSL-like Lipase/Acylhydrolase family protein n=1 Tax=Thermomonospora echinospora TaxID=1992 RepID=A0A1H6C3L1_9ACTN|nr:SGNH/GDSL hydrolase family protein [Thermomonospora echinospora]SEG67277.1 GDSL-like Lipase/Acylhydrolase family protein [Thermomonospora echinospora]
MRVPRLALAAVCAATLTIGLTATARSASAAAVNYVALGDSYSSGLGAGSYDSASGNCKRSNNAYPKLWANANAPASFRFVACSGATTTSIASGQLGALSSATTLVTVTAGGNDAGFANVMETCVLGSDSTCINAVNNAKAFMQNQLPGRLDTLYGAIRSKAPSARVVVLDYPRLYKIVNVCVGLSNTKRTALNGAADLLDSVIAGASGRANFTYSGVRDEFAGHELCSGHDWLNSVTIPIDNSYHPTALGQRSGYYAALNSVL